jgi:hypothetical protein
VEHFAGDSTMSSVSVGTFTKWEEDVVNLADCLSGIDIYKSIRDELFIDLYLYIFLTVVLS